MNEAASGVPALNAVTEAENARLLFRYVTVDEWQDYRQVMAIFAGTFFSDFTPEEVAQRLATAGMVIDEAVVAVRLESLRRWGNLTVSSVTGTPTSLADYYRRRNRYLITRAGQEVHDTVEAVLGRIDEVRDVSTGRLRSLLEALQALAATDLDAGGSEHVGELVRAVFDPHQTFTSEITQFFAAINQWQNRYDLSHDEFSFFAQVLVGYVSERLDEIEKVSRPIAQAISELAEKFSLIAERANRGLAAHVEAAGLAGTVLVSRNPGTAAEDWEHLMAWFVSTPSRPARIEQLRRDALAAVRTLTLNLTRLSRAGGVSSSRRSDLVRLARLVAANPERYADLVNAGLGLFGANHWGILAEDAPDPVSNSTPWQQAPKAVVPVSLRERGETTPRGSASPLPDRGAAQDNIRRQRQREAEARMRADAELAALSEPGERVLSSAALSRLQGLIGRALARMPVGAGEVALHDQSLELVLTRTSAEGTTLRSTEGDLRLRRLRVAVRALPEPEGADR